MFEEFKYNKYIMLYGNLNEHYFNISPIWCHHHNYEEVIELSNIGISKKWLNDAFVNFSEKIKFEYQIHPYFTALKPYDYSKCDFILLKSQFILANNTFDGYSFLINGKLNAINIFFKNSEIVLNEYSLLDEENYKEFMNLNSEYKFERKYINNPNLLITILLDKKIKNYTIPQSIKIPLKKPPNS